MTSEDWDAAAQSFDDEPDHGLRDPAVRAAWREMLLPLLPAAPARIVDLGCGTGTVSVLLAEAGYDLTGLDRSAAMVAAARTKAAAAGVAVSFAVGDASDPSVAAAAFDVVLCRHLLWALPDPGAAIARWVRLLAPNGRLVLVEGRWSTGAGLTAEQVTATVLAHRVEAQVTVLEDDRLWGSPITDDRYVVVSLR